jgi:sugar/nucleoside kinase (ribokinase family)
MKVLVAGHITLDTILLPVRTLTSIGGPPSYAGLICSRLGNDVFALTKVGNDFPADQAVWLSRNGVTIRSEDRSNDRATTKFRIEVSGKERRLYLLSRCEDITRNQVPDSQFHGSLLSPVAGEIPASVVSDVARRSDFTFLDPQGFVRTFGQGGVVTVGRLKDDSILSKVDAVKMDRQEAEAVTGSASPIEALRRLSSRGVKKAVVTNGAEACSVLDGTRVYIVPVPKVQIVDTTGAGDILGGTLLACYIKSREFLWSACFGIAASSLSLHLIALSKVDLPMSVDDQAKRLYSLASPAGHV